MTWTAIGLLALMWLTGISASALAAGKPPAKPAPKPAAPKVDPAPRVDPLVLYTASLRPSIPFFAEVRVDMPTGTAHLEMLGTGSEVYVRSPQSWPQMGEHGMMARPAGQVFKKDVETLISPGLIAENFQVKLLTGDTFLGRPTYRIDLTPKWKGSISRTVLLDRDTLVPLRVEDRDHDDELVQRREITDIDFNPELRRFSVQASGQNASQPDRYASLAEAESLLGFRLAVPSYLPPGFEFYGVRISPAHPGVAHLVFTDGITIVSLFERTVPWWARLASRPKKASEHGFESSNGSLAFYLVGDIPAGELAQIIEAL